jgi:hypothetical protein
MATRKKGKQGFASPKYDPQIAADARRRGGASHSKNRKRDLENDSDGRSSGSNSRSSSRGRE